MTETTITPAQPVPSVPIPSFRKAELKIKIKSLAAEAKLIRGDEQREKSKAKRSPDDTHREWHRSNFWSLRYHRTGTVRDEARYSQLAYAFLRGRPYKTVEPKRAGPEWQWETLAAKKIHAIVSRFVKQDCTKDNAMLAAIDKWLRA